jgi:hypothetical protein
MEQFVRALSKQTEQASDPYECWCITLRVARIIVEAMDEEGPYKCSGADYHLPMCGGTCGEYEEKQ